MGFIVDPDAGPPQGSTTSGSAIDDLTSRLARRRVCVVVKAHRTSRLHPILVSAAVLLVPALASAQASAPINPNLCIPGSSPIAYLSPLIGVGLSSSGVAHALKPQNVASRGAAYHLSNDTPPHRYSAPYAWSRIKGAAMDAADVLHVFYDDGSGGGLRTSGDSTDLDRNSQRPAAVALPRGRRMSDVIDFAIRKSDGKVFAWWRDGTYTEGSLTNVASAAQTFTSALPTSEIVGIAFDGHDLVTTWYRDGTFSRGYPSTLALGGARRNYIHQDIIHARYCPSGSVPGLSRTPPPVMTQKTINGGLDNGIAAGHRFIGVALDSSIEFYDRDGTRLTGGGLGNNGRLDIDDMFDPFVRNTSPQTVSPRDVNNYLGIRDGGERACEWVPDLGGSLNWQSNGLGVCVGNQTKSKSHGGPYDTRVLYDRVGRRFVIVAQMRNQLWTRYFSKYPNQNYGPNTPNQNPPLTSYLRVFLNGTSTGLPLDNSVGKEARRVLAFAISRTDDPRGAWDTYAYAHNIMKDWPFAAINGDWLVLSHRDPSEKGHEEGTIATLVSLADMRQGDPQPQYVRYDQKDLPAYVNGVKPRYVEPAQHLDGWDRTILVSGDLDHYAIYSLPHPTQPYGRRAAKLQQFPAMLRPFALGANPSEDLFEPERSVFRNGTLVTVQQWRSAPLDAWGLRTYRTLLSPRSDGGVNVLQQQTFNSHQVGRYEVEPMPQINAYGQVSVVFGQKLGTYGLPTVVRRDYPNVQLTASVDTVLHSGETWIDTALSRLGAVNALVTSVDPVNDRRFFYIHRSQAGAKFFDPNYETVMGSYMP